ncbi:hypothetical protein ACWCQW_06580 [Streptomyces mirabilis]
MPWRHRRRSHLPRPAAKLNLAYNKSASSSSVFGSGWSAANAVDNNSSTGWSPAESDSPAW